LNGEILDASRKAALLYKWDAFEKRWVLRTGAYSNLDGELDTSHIDKLLSGRE
jgi:hypothetical protein